MRSIISDPDSEPDTRIGDDPRPHVLFDTNAVRSIGALPPEEWDKFKDRWRLHRLRTSWVPHILAEVMGTNLDRKGGLTQRGLRECQRSVNRFNTLAEGVIEDPSEVVVTKSIYYLAGEPYPEPAAAPPWKEGIDLFGRLRSPDDIWFERSGNNLIVTMRGRKEPGERGSIVIPRDFRQRAEDKIRRLASDLPERKRTTIEDLANDAWDEMPMWWPAAAARQEIPGDVIQRAQRSEKDVLRSAFVFTSICGFVYHHWRATGVKGRIRENDAPDLALTAYFDRSRAFVTDDGDLRRLVAAIIDSTDSMFTFEEFREILAQDPA